MKVKKLAELLWPNFTIALMVDDPLVDAAILAALGGLFSGVQGQHIALEGMMLPELLRRRQYPCSRQSICGLLAGMVQDVRGGDPRCCLLAYRADQVVTGTAINILMIGVPPFLSGAFFLSSGATPQIPKGNLIPWVPIGIAFLLVPATWYVLYKTPFGLRLRSVGENPEAADAAGVRVTRMRYAGVLLSGILAGTGGAYLSIGQSSLFTRNMTSGRGFLALAALIFGKWRPVQTMLACLLSALRGGDDSDRE